MSDVVSLESQAKGANLYVDKCAKALIHLGPERFCLADRTSRDLPPVRVGSTRGAPR